MNLEQLKLPNRLRILFLGDITGSSGRKFLSKVLKEVRIQNDIDYVIANGENAAHGKGMTEKIYQQLMNSGIDFFTMGNHTFAKDDIYKIINKPNIVRPANIDNDQGSAYQVVNIKDKKVAIINLLGETFMHNTNGSPFKAMDQILNQVEADLYLVDLHAETTSEKIAFSYYYMDRVQTVVGTHTHVQTADERVINGCAMISDLGMCGAYFSVLGRDVEEIITRYTTNQITRYTIATGKAILTGAIVTYDLDSLQAIDIQRFKLLED